LIGDQENIKKMQWLKLANIFSRFS